MEIFLNRTLVIATGHRKEAVLKPILEEALGVTCQVPTDFDSDRFGTFSGEVDREYDPVSTAREKCLLAMRQTGADLAVASEGSFGPHPSFFFLSSDEEVLVLIDAKHGIELVVREVSAETNFQGMELSDEEQLRAFAERAGFPAHGLILRRSKDDLAYMCKGITDPDVLLREFHALRNAGGTVYVETDMRALYNPTRMKVIGDAARKLVQALRSTCPDCSMPGFVVTDVTRGLPCGWCGMPTNAPLCLIHVCRHCGHRLEQMHPGGRMTEDPGRCGHCNP